MKPQEYFGERLKKLRKSKDLTQSALSGELIKAGVQASPKTVYNWENSERSICIDDLAGVAQYFGVSTDYLLGLTLEKRPADKPVEIPDYVRVLKEQLYNADRFAIPVLEEFYNAISGTIREWYSLYEETYDNGAIRFLKYCMMLLEYVKQYAENVQDSEGKMAVLLSNLPYYLASIVDEKYPDKGVGERVCGKISNYVLETEISDWIDWLSRHYQ